jgi:hypothetical protein
MGREPLRLSATGSVLRVLTRHAEPGNGVAPAMQVSEDGGRSWSTQPLEVGPHADVAGPYGLGMDVRGQVFGRLS